MQKEKVIILGSGPAGLTAALYTARAKLEPLVFVGNLLGGQVSLTHEVENYPGFVEGITGPELVDNMKQQAERFGARLEYAEVAEMNLKDGSPFYIKDGNGKEYEADAVIITVGASARRLGVPGEEEFIGRGVSYCGTCDGFFFRGKDIVVVGGGDSAIEEGIFLTRFANSVKVIHRRDELRAGATLQNRAFSNPKMSFIWDTAVEKIDGNGSVNAVKLHNLKTNEYTVMPTEGVFIFIGHDPNNSLFTDQLEMKDGYLVVDDHMMTNIPGVFAAGEIMDPIFRQVATSVGQGAAAGIAAERWLSEHE
ncbi:MAG: thioredoxin-disulfide reductase [Anaerolineae bacterium]|jgi:thioredoxin reductase (NADPH)|nr:MAG: thioredoxin-disulfide reductase [Anaerolineae bacterium]MCL4877750.1 thioredoxin-disulfide reductase [Anaerolineae bacterium]